MRRGEIWWVDLGIPKGSEPALRRPVVVISGDHYNASTLGTVTVAALTTTRRLAAMPGNVAVAAEVSGLPQDAVVNVTQVATVDRASVEAKVAALPFWVMAQIDEGLRRALDL